MPSKLTRRSIARIPVPRFPESWVPPRLAEPVDSGRGWCTSFVVFWISTQKNKMMKLDWVSEKLCAAGTRSPNLFAEWCTLPLAPSPLLARQASSPEEWQCYCRFLIICILIGETKRTRISLQMNILQEVRTFLTFPLINNITSVRVTCRRPRPRNV